MLIWNNKEVIGLSVLHRKLAMPTFYCAIKNLMLSLIIGGKDVSIHTKTIGIFCLDVMGADYHYIYVNALSSG